MSILNDSELDVLACKYTLKKSPLGTGSYSKVYEAKNNVNDMHYAVKQYSKKLVYGLEDMLLSEFQILKKLSRAHPNILTLVDSFETSNYLYLVTDLATGGELFERVVNNIIDPEQCGHLSEQDTLETVKTLLSAVEYLHANNVVHRDLKSENLLFQTRHSNYLSILVADFGTARIIKAPVSGQQQELLHDMSGTLSYMAPEMLDRSRGHSYEVDMWAVGVLTYFMLCGYMPFDCETDEETKQAIAKADYRLEPAEYWDHVSPRAKDFIDRCFQLDPSKRITAGQALQHPWILKSLSSKLVSQLMLRSSSLTKLLRQSIENLQLPCMHKQVSSGIHSRGKSYSNLESYLSTHSYTSLNSKLSLIELSRYASLADGTTLQGSYCESPDMISNFNSPSTSENGSRQQSYSKLDSLLDSLKGDKSESTLLRSQSKSTFII